MNTRATVIHAIPTVITFAALIAVGWWGHRTGWTLSRGHSAPVGEHDEHGAQWCPEHAVPEAECLLCRKSFAKEMKAKEPKTQVDKGEEIRFAQVASVEALALAHITTAAATATTHEPTLTVPAETIYDPTRVSRVATRLPGTVRQIGKRLGDAVAVGDVLAVIEAADVGRMKSDLMRALAEQAAARATSQRISASAESGFRTAGEAREALARMQAAQIAVFDAEQALLNLGFTVSATALADLDAATLATHLRSLGLPEGASMGSANLLPILAVQAGTVTDVKVVPGEAVEAGALLATVADTQQLWLSLAVSPAQAATIAAGQTIRFTTDAFAGSGTISLVAPAADDVTRLVPVHAMIDNAAAKLRANQVGTATVVLGAAQPTVLVPASAVQYDGPTAYVFVQRTPTIFRGLPVRVLATTTEGLAVDRLIAGDVIAVTGTDVLKGNLFQDKFGPGCACGKD